MAKKKLDKSEMGNVSGGWVRQISEGKFAGNFGVYRDYPGADGGHELVKVFSTLQEAQNWANNNGHDDVFDTEQMMDPHLWGASIEKIKVAPDANDNKTFFTPYGFDDR